MNKKAAVIRHFWWLFVRIPLFIVVIGSIVIFRGRILQEHVDPGSIQYDVLVNRMFKTFGYVSPNTGRIYPNIIDQRKFTNETLASSIDTDKSLAVRLSLTGVNPIFFNKEFYEFSEELRGAVSRYKEVTYSSPVQILTRQNQIIQGRFDISIFYEETR